MEKKMIILMNIISILFLIGCEKPETPSDEISKTVIDPIASEIVQQSPEQTPIVEERSVVPEQETTVAENKHNLIFPTLTYDGAYNGPLYGTSEQVGAVSMDSYFNLLNKNGINYFIGMFGIEGEP